MNQLLKYALKYAELGWCIFPLAPGQKTPITPHGVKDATRDAAQINAWWAKWPTANIGVACGKASGVYVIDVDVSAAGDVSGLESLKEFPQLPVTITQSTPRGGFHAFFQASVPPANRNSFRPGIDIRGEGYYVVLTPSIHPNGGVYKWDHGFAPWEITANEYPDFMRPVTKAPWANYTSPSTTATKKQTQSAMSRAAANMSFIPPIADINDVARRASLWLAQCDPAVQGLGGHDKLFWAAQGLVNGCRLSDTQAYSLLSSEYNPRCQPPWALADKSDHKDFFRKITEARANPPRDKPIGWIIDDDSFAPQSSTCTVDLKSIMSGTQNVGTYSVVQPEIGEVDASKELAFLTQPTGLLGEICSWINRGSIRKQPLLTLACSLAWLGVLYGRKIEDERGGRTNLYCMGVARSSSGKDHAPRQIRRLATESGNLGLLGGNDLASDAAIEERMSRAPATIFLLDEIGHLLANIKSGHDKNKSQIISVLMRLYSSAPDVYLGREYADAEKQRIIIEPCCCLYGTSTPERFAAGITPDEVQDGWLGRCLVFNSTEFPRKTICRKLDIPKQLIEKCAAWTDRGIKKTDGVDISQYVTGDGLGKYQPNPNPTEPEKVFADSAANKLFLSLDSFSEKQANNHQAVSSLWLKAEESARRISLILSASDFPEKPRIDERIASYSCRLVRYLLSNFCTAVAPEIVSSGIQHEKRRVFDAIKQSGKAGATQGELTRRTQWTNKRHRKELVEDLVEAGEIAFEVQGKTLRYWTAELFLKREVTVG